MSQVQELIHVSRTCTYIYRIIQSEELNYEQKQWRYFRMGRPFPKPYRPWPKTKKEFEYKTFSFADVNASVEPLEETDD